MASDGEVVFMILKARLREIQTRRFRGIRSIEQMPIILGSQSCARFPACT